MRVAFHGATTMTSDLETDVRVTANAGFKALELWATKVDKYLETHSVDELKALLANNNVAPMTFNSIEFIAFRGSDFEQIKARLPSIVRTGPADRLSVRSYHSQPHAQVRRHLGGRGGRARASHSRTERHRL